MLIKEWFRIESNERFLLLKLMNGLYGISLTENAVNTQKLLSKIVAAIPRDSYDISLNSAGYTPTIFLKTLEKCLALKYPTIRAISLISAVRF
jgi:hypothetical protein